MVNKPSIAFFQHYNNTSNEWACSSNRHVLINAKHGYFITNGPLVHDVVFKQNIQNLQQGIKWIYQYDFWKEEPGNLFKLEIDS